MKKTLFLIFSVISLLLIVLWQMFFSEKTSWYVVACAVLFLSILPFFLNFERKRATAQEMALISVLVALAVVSRAVFYLIPQVKPIAAVVIVSAVCLGGCEGYLVGSISALISNFVFGQGIWTPFQMVALGLVGFVSGVIFNTKNVSRIKLAICGFFLSAFLYGAVVDLSTVFMTVTDFSLKSVFAVYAAGAVFDLVFGVSTAVFLFIFGVPFIKKIERIQTKYGLFYNL